jgi:hypothetical protein
MLLLVSDTFAGISKQANCRKPKKNKKNCDLPTGLFWKKLLFPDAFWVLNRLPAVNLTYFSAGITRQEAQTQIPIFQHGNR